jgi:Na+:H+ antiporter, NhaA family
VKLSKVFNAFFENEKASGVVLLICTAVSMLLANSPFKESYISFFEININGTSILHWINEGLMTIFFLLIGLELEREFYIGELSKKENAILPLVGALGGMIVPAIVFLLFNYGTAYSRGAGIPMATDIAFALGALSLLGKRIPAALKIFLAALAVIDDLGAIVVISFFYSNTIAWLYLLYVAIIWAILFVLNRLKIYYLIIYIIGGVAMWYCMLHSGVHASITGVILAFVIPFSNGKADSISYKLELALQKPVAFFIVPLFVLANTAINISADSTALLKENASLGVFAGLVIGKPLGILSFCFIAIKLGIAKIPIRLKFKHFIGVGFLGGIGFTMSVFIALLAYEDSNVINASKLIIIIASFVAACIGLVILYFSFNKSEGNTKQRVI